MTSYAGIAARHVNTYHHNTSLLFQFILADFIEAFAEIRCLETLCNSPSAANSGKEKPTWNAASGKLEIEAALTKLVGSPRDYMRLFSWNFSEGLLAKLRTYCALFTQNSDSDDKEFLALQHYADKIWQACLLAVDALHENPSERTPLIAALDKASTAMHRFAKLVARLLQQFRDDENVIYYLVRNHKIFDKLYGSRFVAKQLNRIYPKGVREAQHFLIKKYSARGFENILPALCANIAEIEASAL